MVKEEAPCSWSPNVESWEEVIKLEDPPCSCSANENARSVQVLDDSLDPWSPSEGRVEKM
jgi:hypothetical protein